MTDQTAEIAFIRHELAERQTPPGSTVGFVGWVRQNLFNGVRDTILTLVGLYLIVCHPAAGDQMF